MTDSSGPSTAHLAWNDLVGGALMVMAGTMALGTSLGWFLIRDCADDVCSSLPAAVRLLIGLGYCSAASLFFGAIVFLASSQRPDPVP